MFAKITIAVALILGTSSGALAVPKQKHNTNRADLYDTHGQQKTTHRKTTHAKTAHAKTARKQKGRTSQAYVAYEGRGLSFGAATSAPAMAHLKQSSDRYHQLYNTRAQYIGPTSRAAAAPKLKHSSNPANDVFDIRGWYIGSDPDPIVRFMMMIDPSSSD